MFNFSVIAAVTSKYGIGYKGGLPWKDFSLDMQWFRKKTLGNTVIMGNNTFKSMNNKPLKKRDNIVISTNSQLYNKLYKDVDDLRFCDNLNEALCKSYYGNNYVIGGSELYKSAIESKYCNEIYLTYLNDKSMELSVDTYFPYINNNYKLDKIMESGLADVCRYDDVVIKYPYKILRYERLNDKLNYKVYLGESGYLDSINDIMIRGELNKNRTGIDTISLFGLQFRYNLGDGFPLFTTKNVHMKSIIEELLWFLNGKTDVKILQEQNVHIWDGNTSKSYLNSIGLNHLEEGDGGPIYGFQFRHFGAKYINSKTNYENQGFDQVNYVLNELKKDITLYGKSRRAIINLWNSCDIDKMSLPPCHVLYQFSITNNNKLNCSMYQRSGDMGLGVPFNVASMALMTHMFAKLCNLDVGEIIHTIGDAHIYVNHINQLKEQINRKPYALSKLVINGNQTKIEDFDRSDFNIIGYQHYPTIKMEMVV